jgi:hypothetical protein
MNLGSGECDDIETQMERKNDEEAVILLSKKKPKRFALLREA